jgi:hypothetical protein
MCPSYLSKAPRWWIGRRREAFPIPYDVWGRIESIESNGDTRIIQMIDAALRRVRIEGLTKHTIEGIQSGSTVYLFNLESKEPRSMHGSRVQPRNFHELPASQNSRYKKAVNLQLLMDS